MAIGFGAVAQSRAGASRGTLTLGTLAPRPLPRNAGEVLCVTHPAVRGSWRPAPRRWCQRLPAKMRAEIKDSAMHDGIAGVAGGEQYQQVRPLPACLVGELPPGHAARQPDIGEQQADAGMPRQHLQASRAVRRHQDAIAQLPQRLGAVGTHVLVVFHHQDQFARATRRRLRLCSSSCNPCCATSLSAAANRASPRCPGRPRYKS